MPAALPPLVPPDVDLRDFPFVPLYRKRLIASRFHHLANDAEWRAGVMLWFASWDQHPAGSLPNDDHELSQLAGLGRDTRQWRKVKKWALYHWQLCDDGRLYHHVVAEVVNDVWQRKEANRHRTQAARNKKRNRVCNEAVTEPVTDSVTSPSPLHPSPLGEGQGQFVALPERVESQSSARANGHAREDEKINENAGPLGRSAPLARSARLGGVKGQRKELLRQKVMRFAHSTMNADDRQAAFIGILGEDKEHSAQWWLDHLDQSMRAARWDDAT